MTSYERELGILTVKVEQMESDIAEMKGKVNQMHELLLQARGAKWAIIGVASLAGFLAGKAGWLLQLFGVRIGG